MNRTGSSKAVSVGEAMACCGRGELDENVAGNDEVGRRGYGEVIIGAPRGRGRAGSSSMVIWRWIAGKCKKNEANLRGL